MNYKECLLYLEHIQNLGIKFGLDNVRTILEAFDNPHHQYPSILVGGSNGKGSVCAMITRILSLHKLRVGLYTSPHLVRVEERIRIGQRLISIPQFCRILSLLKSKIEELIDSHKLLSHPTYFELLTCLAFLYFCQQRVAMAILEVGMGGRYDATNVVEPLLTIITTISAEHQKFLGESLGQIALEKAGIIRRGVPVVCGVEEEIPYLAIKKKAQEMRAPFYGIFDGNQNLQAVKGEKGYSFEYRSSENYYRFFPSLAGYHQGKNAAMVIAAAEQLSQRWKRLEKKKIIRGLEETRWEGRLEIVLTKPLVILDGAHNEEGAKALRDYIRQFIPSPLILVIAMMRDKKIKKIADVLFPLAEKIIVTRFPYFRAAPPEEIQRQAIKYINRIILEPDPQQAFKLALQQANKQGAVVVAGSLYLVGEIKKISSTEKLTKENSGSFFL